ncbi:hypothetical protein CHGG_09918 [Chaetomium globosum CBS 148.51]|uniref:tripeptidyl-peptidase II n=1 Tax=Chaetomium globosum (strain ATCC 6205 / CBS 148.51 / DSM 1962 / NBRC 6347 / NRRL 1970) TaxID=306901 RepID=Q2GQ36_CHAGB|nr:uncharacterized protein CHGG_09918 [Chaetomium globosum CBS 148.51]EAQ83514.1 hypothetical protein CHGG_09918 [Chaetomium globosum CBS 148.51]
MRLLGFTLFGSVVASYALKEHHDIPSGWRMVRPADKSRTMYLQIGLAQGRMDEIIRNLEEDAAETLLQTKYSEFHHSETNSLAVRSPSWSLPAHLHGHIESIQPTTSFLFAASPLRPRQDNSEDLNQAATEEASTPGSVPFLDLLHLPKNLTVSQACNASAVTPLCIRVLYGAHSYAPKAAHQNSMALVNYSGEFNNLTDLDLFLRLYRPDAQASFISHPVAGGINFQTPLTPAQRAQRDGREGALDAQILFGIAAPTPLIAYTVGGALPPFIPSETITTNTNEPFLTWLQYMLALPDEALPRVVATSYGDDESTVPPAYARRVCEGFAQLGLRGVTIVFGAGDWGVGKPEVCADKEFVTSFPASCPYGTSVAATRGVVKEEVAYNDGNGFVSGGGFSRHFKRPGYQSGKRSVVDAYLGGVVKREYEGRYRREGRAYPDVAAQGYRRPIVWDGKTYLVDGTSASAPTFAAMVALVNDALLAAGEPPMGFLNPWLYAGGHEAFTDVTLGSSKGCNTSGFHATPGWDSASGFGTPWFPKFKELAMNRRFRQQRPWYWPAVGVK